METKNINEFFILFSNRFTLNLSDYLDDKSSFALFQTCKTLNSKIKNNSDRYKIKKWISHDYISLKSNKYIITRLQSIKTLPDNYCDLYRNLTDIVFHADFNENIDCLQSLKITIFIGKQTN